MRDPELLVTLLRKMSVADDKSGRMFSSNTLDGRDPEERHHLELLIDAGQAEWISDHVIRITSDGYDFLNAIDNDENTWKKLLEYLDKGIPYVIAARKVIEFLI